MANGYRPYMPFHFAEGRKLGDPLPHKGPVGAYLAELKRVEPHYALLVEQIPTEEAAALQFEKLKVGLYWVALETQSGVLFKSGLQRPYFPTDSIQAAKNIFGEATDRRADVIIDGGEPAIWPEGKHHVTFTGQPVGLTLSYSPPWFLDVLNEGLQLPNAAGVLAHPKLKLAIDLYCLSHFRSSDFARFLVLFVALETAAPQQRPHTKRIRRYVKETLDAGGHADADELAREIEELYKVRGTLSHEGAHELGDGLSRLDDIVCKTLKAAMRHVSA